MSAIALIGSVASAGIGYMQQTSLINSQNQANNEWVAYQRQQAQDEWAKETAARQRAEAARQGALEKVAPDAQKAAQQTEEQRVQTDITPTNMLDQNPQLIGDKLLSGQKGGNAQVQGQIADQITQASRDARARIAALSTIQSYGGSQFGLQNRAQDIFNQSGQDIRLQGDFRTGDLAAYNAAKAVPVRQFAASPSPFGGIAGALAGIAGKGIGASV
jgi:hypothetical protein